MEKERRDRKKKQKEVLAKDWCVLILFLVARDNIKSSLVPKLFANPW